MSEPSRPRLPIVILAGSDRRTGPHPDGTDKLHFVVGYKGAELRLGGRPLIQIVVERIRQSGAFGEIYVTGPSSVYASLVDATVIDTDSFVGTNIARAVKAVRERHGTDTRMALIACDVLPTGQEIAELAEALEAPDDASGRRARGDAPPALAMSLVEWTDDYGASSYKPRYMLRAASDGVSGVYLPGHLGVLWPRQLRLGLFLRLLDLAYRKRNLNPDERRRFIISRGLGLLLWRDLMNLLRLRPPTLTYTVLRHGMRGFFAWKRGELTLEGFAYTLGRIAVRRRFFKASEGRAVHVAISRAKSFARDIDTEEELDEIAGERESGGA